MNVLSGKPFTYERQVEMSEVDAAGILHFSRYLQYMEAAEAAFLLSLELPVFIEGGESLRGFPRVRVEFNYRLPARLGDRLRLCLRELEVGRSSLTTGFDCFRLRASEECLIGHGLMKSAYAEMHRLAGTGRALPLPDLYRERLQAYLAS